MLINKLLYYLYMLYATDRSFVAFIVVFTDPSVTVVPVTADLAGASQGLENLSTFNCTMF